MIGAKYFISFDHNGNFKHKGEIESLYRGEYLVHLHPFKPGNPIKIITVPEYDALDWETHFTEEEWHQAADEYMAQFNVEGGNQDGNAI